MRQFGSILNYLNNVLITNIEEEKKNLLLLAETTVKIVRCLLKIPDQPLDNPLLLIRHVIYNRSILSEEELPQLMEVLCALRHFLPFDDLGHRVWGTEALAKVANNLANAIKVSLIIDLMVEITVPMNDVDNDLHHFAELQEGRTCSET